MSDSCVFIVEDDPWYSDLLEYYIKLDPEYTVEKYLTGKECLANLYKNPLAISLDFSLPDYKGTEMLKQILMADGDIVKPDDITLTAIDQKEDLLQKELSLDEYTKEIIKYYLEKYDHKVIPVAKKLKIAKSTLYRLIQKYELG